MIFLTTHYIEEAERLCDRIAFIVKGKLVNIDSVANLLQPEQERKALLIAISKSTNDLCGKLSTAFPSFQFRAISTEQIQVETVNTISIGPLVRFIEEQGAEVIEARRLRPSLEEVFVRVTGLELDLMRKEKEKGGGSK